jgi:hypothetical protein
VVGGVQEGDGGEARVNDEQGAMTDKRGCGRSERSVPSDMLATLLLNRSDESGPQFFCFASRMASFTSFGRRSSPFQRRTAHLLGSHIEKEGLEEAPIGEVGAKVLQQIRGSTGHSQHWRSPQPTGGTACHER